MPRPARVEVGEKRSEHNEEVLVALAAPFDPEHPRCDGGDQPEEAVGGVDRDRAQRGLALCLTRMLWISDLDLAVRRSVRDRQRARNMLIDHRIFIDR